MGSSTVGVGCISAEFMGGEERFDEMDVECWCELREEDALVEMETLIDGE